METSYNALTEGDRVSFDIVEGTQGPAAAAVNVGWEQSSDDDLAEQEIEKELTDEDEEVEVANDIRIFIANFSRRLAELIARNPTVLDSLEWRDLERVVAEIFAELGFDTTLTPGSKDGGKDVIISYSVNGVEKSFVVEIKHWRSGKRVGIDTVTEFVHVIVKENRHGGLFLATYGYSKGVVESLFEIERQKRLGFGEGEKLVSLCRNYVRSREGTWYPPEQRENIIFEDTTKGRSVSRRALSTGPPA